MSSPDPIPLRLPVPEAGFRLEPDVRANVLPCFDVEALERLLSMVNPPLRDELLQPFLRRLPGEPSPGWLGEIFDAELQEVLEEVWVPYWDDTPVEDLDHYEPLPGRTLARERRAARAEPPSQQPSGA